MSLILIKMEVSLFLDIYYVSLIHSPSLNGTGCCMLEEFLLTTRGLQIYIVIASLRWSGQSLTC